MTSSNVSEGRPTPSHQLTTNETPKRKAIGIAIIIILSLGSLAVAGIGLGGYLQAGSLSHLGQMNSIVMMAAGSGSGIVFLILGIVISFKHRQQDIFIYRPPRAKRQKLDPLKNESEQNIQVQQIYGKEAWSVWNVEILESVPDIPKINWQAIDPIFNEPFLKNYVLIYIPNRIKKDGKEMNLTFNTFQKISQGPFAYIHDSINKEFENTMASGWVLMSKQVAYRGEDYSTQKRLIEAQEDFKMLNVLEAVVLNLMIFASTGKQVRLYGRRPITYSRCIQNSNPVVVGGFASNGLEVDVLEFENPFSKEIPKELESVSEDLKMIQQAADESKYQCGAGVALRNFKKYLLE